MENQASENSEQAVAISDVHVHQNHDNSLANISNHGDDFLGEESEKRGNSVSLCIGSRCVGTFGSLTRRFVSFVAKMDWHKIESDHDFSKQEVISILEAIAGTGKFWHDWDKLKYMLSFHLKEVLSEYPEATMTSEEQTLSLGETFPELVKRLDDAIHNFIEGPPFTLQRLCEILLAARSIYPQLSKLALALEKNLFVTSMLTKSTEPPAPEQGTVTSERANGGSRSPSNPLPNGVETLSGDRDEIMTEVEEAEVEDDMTIDMETIDEIVRSSETSSAATIDSHNTMPS